MKYYCSASLLVFLFKIQAIFAQQTQSIYSTETLQIHQISPNSFVHISYLNTDDFGKVGCNGMIVIHGGEAVVFDTPANEVASGELIRWLENEQKVNIKAILATHFHNDCLGGLKSFHAIGVPSYGTHKTIALAKKAGELTPKNGFSKKIKFDVGDLAVETRYFGEGHTRDNVVAFVPSDQLLFGGCLIKAQGASFGFLGDANTGSWSETVKKVKSSFPNVQTVIPGHGNIGGVELLDYTIRLFEGK